MDLLPERRSIRLRGYDYRTSGFYFVTICTHNKRCILGEIRHGIMGLSNIGCVVAKELQQTSILRPYVRLDTWIIMPNHLHILWEIDRGLAPPPNVRAPRRGAPTPIAGAPTRPRNSAWNPNSLGSMINQLKSICTKRIRPIYPEFSWQRNYYEHICRNPEDIDRIRTYILRNPLQWTRKYGYNPLPS